MEKKDIFDFIYKLIKLLKPEFYNKITWTVVIAGLALLSTSLIDKIINAVFMLSFQIKLTDRNDAVIGIALVIIGLGYHLMIRKMEISYAFKNKKIENDCSLSLKSIDQNHEIARKQMEHSDSLESKKRRNDALLKMAIIIGEKQRGFNNIHEIFSLKQDRSLYELPKNKFWAEIGSFAELRALANESVPELLKEVNDLERSLNNYHNDCQNFSMVLKAGIEHKENSKRFIDDWGESDNESQAKLSNINYQILLLQQQDKFLNENPQAHYQKNA